MTTLMFSRIKVRKILIKDIKINCLEIKVIQQRKPYLTKQNTTNHSKLPVNNSGIANWLYVMKINK